MSSQIDPRFVRLAHRLDLRAPVICDIGSRDAQEGIGLLKQLAGSALHVFEPNPEAAEKCRANLRPLETGDVSISFNQVGLLDREGWEDFFSVDVNRSENKDIGFSSFFKINPTYSRRRREIVQKRIRVEVTTLDRYFETSRWPDVLWLDAEGSELSVLRGARQVLHQVKLIQTEVAMRPMQVGRPLFWEVDSYLRSFGFQFLWFVELHPGLAFLYRHRLLPNLPWRLNAVYARGEAL